MSEQENKKTEGAAPEITPEETKQVEEINNAKSIEELDKAEAGIENKADKNKQPEEKKDPAAPAAEDKNANPPKEKNDPDEKKEIPADAKKKTLIPEDFRKQFGVPEKFKYMEDFVAWGSEAEKARSRFDAERNKAIAEKEQYKKELEGLKAKLSEQVKQGTITPEEKQAAINAFRDKFEEDPIQAMQEVIQEIIKPAEQPKEPGGEHEELTPEQQEARNAKKKEIILKAQEDFNAMTENMSPEERQKFANELKPIADEFPDVTSVKALHMIYLGRKHITETKLREEEEKKNKEKAEAATIDAAKHTDDEKTSVEAIKGAKTLDELEKEEAKIK